MMQLTELAIICEVLTFFILIALFQGFSRPLLHPLMMATWTHLGLVPIARFFVRLFFTNMTSLSKFESFAELIKFVNHVTHGVKTLQHHNLLPRGRHEKFSYVQDLVIRQSLITCKWWKFIK